MQNNIKKLAYLMSFLMLSAPLASFAKEVSLYDQPNANAKVVSKVDLSIGVVPIYTPENSEWIKVGDPRNGNTGWIKSEDLNGANNAVTFDQQIIENGNGPHTMQYMHFGQPYKPLTPEQKKEMMMQLQLQQQNMQRHMQQQMLQMQHEFEEMQHGFPWMNGPHMPMMMPVVFVPVEQQQPVKKPTASQPKPAASTPTTKPANTP